MRTKMKALAFVLAAVSAAGQAPEARLVFEAGTAGYAGFRIPALVMTQKGTLLAFCAARKELGDWADIDIAMRRSTDGGRTWSPMRIIADRGAMTVDNPVPIVDRKTGAIHFLFQVNYAQLFYMRSDDDGLAFSEPRDITETVHGFRRGWAPEKSETKYGWSVVAPGPGHGIQLRNGRLLATVWMSPHYRHRPSAVATIYSDDAGTTWKSGALIPFDAANPLVNPSEHVALELEDGRVMTSIRSEGKEHRRAAAVSPDGISNWSVPERQEELFEAVCMASLVRVAAGPEQKNRIVFANPARLPRNDLTLRVSYDEGKTWPHEKLLLAGPTGYSDMAAGPRGELFILYEQAAGEGGGRRMNLLFAQITMDWLTGGQDSGK